MRKFGEILKETPFEKIKQEYLKEYASEGLPDCTDSLRNIYKELLEVEMYDSDKVLLLCPLCDRDETAPGEIQVGTDFSLNYLSMKEIRKLHGRHGILYYYRTLDRLIEEMENLLKIPEKLTVNDIFRMQLYPDMPEIHGMWDIAWKEIPSLQVYEHDIPSLSDAALVTATLMAIASVAGSEAEYAFYYNDFDHSEKEEDEEDNRPVEEKLKELDDFLNDTAADDNEDAEPYGLNEKGRQEMMVHELTDCRNEYQAMGRVVLYGIYKRELDQLRQAMCH